MTHPGVGGPETGPPTETPVAPRPAVLRPAAPPAPDAAVRQVGPRGTGRPPRGRCLL